MTDEERRQAEGPLPIEQPALHVVLVEPEIAANAGAVGRTCVAAGATLWLVRPLGFHLSDRHRKRAGLDYWDHLDWRACDSLDAVVDAIRPNKLWLFSTKVSRSHLEARFHRGDALVFGPESRGLPASLLALYPDQALRIPMASAARSLNLATAVAIGVYEARRQIGWD